MQWNATQHNTLQQDAALHCDIFIIISLLLPLEVAVGPPPLVARRVQLVQVLGARQLIIYIYIYIYNITSRNILRMYITRWPKSGVVPAAAAAAAAADVAVIIVVVVIIIIVVTDGKAIT